MFKKKKKNLARLEGKIFFGLTLVFFALSWAFIVMCDRLMEDKV